MDLYEYQGKQYFALYNIPVSAGGIATTVDEAVKAANDAQYPVVCMDELNKQLVSETRQPLPAIPGKPARYDFEYKREGVANAFICFEPLGNRRTITIRTQRTHREWAELRWQCAASWTRS